MNASYSNKSGSVWGPPYSGGLGQTAPVARPVSPPCRRHWFRMPRAEPKTPLLYATAEQSLLFMISLFFKWYDVKIEKSEKSIVIWNQTT